MAKAAVHFDEKDFVNSRGMRLNTCRWLPAVEKEMRGLIFLCHGYGVECTVYTWETGQRLASAGYGVYGIDYEGHGKSEGLRGYIPSFDNLVTDCATFFQGVMNRQEYAGKRSFLMGESMGAAVSFFISRRDPGRWSGFVLMSPMLKLAEILKPRPIVISILMPLRNIIPTWKLVPSKDLFSLAYKDPIKREKIRSNPYVYRGTFHRMMTSLQLLLASTFVEEHLSEVSVPFLVVHGTDDTVNDPEASEKLFESAVSVDKTLKLYPGMWHGITAEPNENVDLVFQDITRWLDDRAEGDFCNTDLLQISQSQRQTDVAMSKLDVHESVQNGQLKLLST